MSSSWWGGWLQSTGRCLAPAPTPAPAPTRISAPISATTPDPASTHTPSITRHNPILLWQNSFNQATGFLLLLVFLCRRPNRLVSCSSSCLLYSISYSRDLLLGQDTGKVRTKTLSTPLTSQTSRINLNFVDAFKMVDTSITKHNSVDSVGGSPHSEKGGCRLTGVKKLQD